MKKLSLVFVAFFVVAQNAFSQCAMCKVVAEQSSSNELEFGHNINYGIVFLMVVPYIIIFLLFRKQIVALFKELRHKSSVKKD